MCGRFVGYRRREELLDLFPIDRCEVEVTASYNIAPTQEILAIVRQEGQNHLKHFHWGLVPFWAKDRKIGNRLINARAETVAEKPSFRSAFAKRRCLIVADGFYEWKKLNGLYDTPRNNLQQLIVLISPILLGVLSSVIGQTLK